MKIQHHIPRSEFLEKRTQKSIERREEQYNKLIENRNMSGYVGLDLLKSAALLALFNHQKDAIASMNTSMKALWLNFLLRLPESSIFSFEWNASTVTLHGNGNTSFTDDETWAKGIFLSTLLNDRPALDYLLTVPDATFQNSNLKGLIEFEMAYARLLRGLFNPKADMSKLLADAMESSFPDKIPAPRQDYVNLLKYPEVVLIRCLLSPNPAEFNEKLHEALLSHKEFWSTEDRAYDPEGWLSLPLTAIAHLAWTTKRWEITVESDYLPMWLVKGE